VIPEKDCALNENSLIFSPQYQVLDTLFEPNGEFLNDMPEISFYTVFEDQIQASQNGYLLYVRGAVRSQAFTDHWQKYFGITFLPEKDDRHYLISRKELVLDSISGHFESHCERYIRKI
jgi:hypothetical protein